MSKEEVNPKELAQFIRTIASGIDASKSPRSDLVASDIRCAIAAVNGDAGAVKHLRDTIAMPASPAVAAAPSPAPRPAGLSFKGELNGDLMSRAAAELIKRRPDLQGRKLQISISAKPE